MARLGEIPHSPYYGSIDATPLFILLFTEAVTWGATMTGAFRRPSAEHPRRALDWVERYGDVDGDGLSRVSDACRATGSHIVHQSWKDSHDSLHHADGRPGLGHDAPVEVQGYLFAAYRSLADLVAARRRVLLGRQTCGDEPTICDGRVEERFWLAERGLLRPRRLMGTKRRWGRSAQIPATSCTRRPPDPGARGRAVAARMHKPDLDSGSGIRSLSSSDARTYNPMSYHNGSVWPHDNSLIAAGLRRYGFADDANRIASALFVVAEGDPLTRLPDSIAALPGPIPLPKSPPTRIPGQLQSQAWAAAASQLLVRAMLGLRIDRERGVLLVDAVLPEWLSEVSIPDLTVLGQPAALTVRRTGDEYTLETEGPVRCSEPKDRATSAWVIPERGFRDPLSRGSHG